jgi:hypothetical protein
MNFDVAVENFGRVEFGLGRNEAYPMFYTKPQEV